MRITSCFHIELFAIAVPVIAVDPYLANASAIAVYRKLGFQVTGSVQQIDWERILSMTVRFDNINKSYQFKNIRS
ncbi:N-acetyltransferase [Candidatus Nitrosoglobus terrae]|uniref:hypothetical protein n=1 Tax=Candidatus Nitrosoglobus terrae TaxID=1630141 RepID=UPI0015536AF9|nr:hypothetical protein [Candidatus Nitrosoglobus terrae]